MNISAATLEDTRVHLVQLSQFLESWKWLTITRPTHIFIDGILDAHSDIIGSMSFLSSAEHLDILSGNVGDELPTPVREVLESATRLGLELESVNEGVEVVQSLQKRTSAKKLHETSRLSTLVSSICESQSLKCVVDIGSGLGYVDREICRVVEDCEILAVESEEARCTSAHAKNKLLGMSERIKQFPLKLQGSNVDAMSDVLGESMKGPGCMIALHACGDLTPTALRLFEKTHLIESAVILSCCYHKMEHSEKVFQNFPMSDYLKDRLASGSLDPALADVSFLRLAAESSKEMWASRGAEELSLHARSVAYRALLELYAHKNGIKFSKKVRKAVKAGSKSSWRAYTASWVANTAATRISDGQTVKSDFLLSDLQNFRTEEDVWELVQKTLSFNTLKSCVQHLAELLVLEDRLLALMEVGLSQCRLVRVSDPSISPRSIAVVVRK